MIGVSVQGLCVHLKAVWRYVPCLIMLCAVPYHAMCRALSSVLSLQEAFVSIFRQRRYGRYFWPHRAHARAANRGGCVSISKQPLPSLLYKTIKTGGAVGRESGRAATARRVCRSFCVRRNSGATHNPRPPRPFALVASYLSVCGVCPRSTRH